MESLLSGMEWIEPGDRVKLILDKERSPDNKWHGETGVVKEVYADDLGKETRTPVDSLLFEVELDNGEVPEVHFRFDDLVLLEEHERELGIKE